MSEGKYRLTPKELRGCGIAAALAILLPLIGLYFVRGDLNPVLIVNESPDAIVRIDGQVVQKNEPQRLRGSRYRIDVEHKGKITSAYIFPHRSDTPIVAVEADGSVEFHLEHELIKP